MQPPFTRRAIAYLKARVDDGAPAVPLSDADAPILHPIADPLVVSYAVDQGDRYELVQRRHLEEDGIDEASLRRTGLENLARLVNERPTRVQPYGNIFAVLMGGDFEASLILLDALWDGPFRQFVPGDYAAAVPARDVLSFCDAGSAAGVAELQQLIERVYPTGDHRLSDRRYLRRDGAWRPL